MEEFKNLISKPSLTEEEELKLKTVQNEIDKIYIELAKGAAVRSRMKWLEEGEKTLVIFFH